MATAKILIVEDEILIAKKIELTLRQLGYVVTGIAQDAVGALQHVAHTLPDLVLMDIVIQGAIDGIAVAAQIHDSFQIPIIYLTAYADESTLDRAKLTHPLGYLLKPFHQRELQVAIELALFKQRDVQRQTNAPTHAVMQQKAQTMSQLLLMLSHDLRNPLATIKLSATILADYSNQLAEDMKQTYLRRIHLATDSMNRLLEDVLTLGWAESDQEQFNPTHLNVVKLCNDLIEASHSNHDRCALVFSCQADRIDACVDENLLWHLLSNLLSNAVKYSHDGSTVTLTLFCDVDVDELCFVVQDEGIGILPEDQVRLFEPFQRGSNVGKLPGTGLGLAIAKRAVELHHGCITIESQVEQGTTLTVRLPLGLQKGLQEKPVSPTVAPQEGGATAGSTNTVE